MSDSYKASDEVPDDVLCGRLDKLSDAVTKGQAGLREFDMRVPAEWDRDADLVIAEASRRILSLRQRLKEVEADSIKRKEENDR